MSILKSNFCTERLRCRLDILRLRFSEKEKELFLFLCGDSLSDVLRFILFGVSLQKQGPFFLLFDSASIQSRQVAIVSDSGDVKLFF